LLDADEFECWIKASHEIFEGLEGRYDAYPLAASWTQQWLESSIFIVQNEHLVRINNLMSDLDYDVFGIKEQEAREIDAQFKTMIEESLKIGKNENIGFALAPYLFTWNFKRFKEYFTRKHNFKLDEYFKELGNFLKQKRREIKYFQNKKLVKDKIERNEIISLFNDLNGKLRDLGIHHNEPIGTIKILHACSPYYFPLIDNDIAETFKLKRRYETLKSSHYLRWMDSLKQWLSRYDQNIIEKLEEDYQRSILKLVDQALYIMCSVNFKKRIGLKVDDR